MAQHIELKNNTQLEKLLLSNPEMEKKVRTCIRKIMTEAQCIVQQYALRFSTKEAYKAIRKVIYKKVLGGNLNIITGRKRSGNRAPLPPVYHKLEHSTNSKGNHRGGNRMYRSRRTEDLLTYIGEDRGFILRFNELGTPHRNGNGVRQVGQINGSTWFGTASITAINNALIELDRLIDKAIQEQFNTK